MFSYVRLKDLLDCFLASEDFINQKQLVEQFNISSRTLRNDIHILNEEIRKFNVQIITVRNKGYTLKGNKQDIYNLKKLKNNNSDFQLLDSSERRINHLILKLLYSENYISPDDMADDVFVSINTIINYVKTIRIILAKYNLTLLNKANLGYIVKGNEVDKRKCIFNLMTSEYQSYELTFSNQQKQLLENFNLEDLKTIITDFNRKNSIHSSDYNLKNLILHIALSISRINVSQEINSDYLPEIEKIDNLLSPLIEKLEDKFNISFSNGEKNYIYSHYVSNTNNIFSLNNDSEYLEYLINKMLEAIYDVYHFDFRTDIILKKDLSHHLENIFNAKYFNLNKKNPLLNTIKSKYVLAYEITETSIKQALENESINLTEDEIGYISLHVGAAMERYYDLRISKNKSAIILYHSGYAIGSFISAKLTTYFKESLDIEGIYPANELNIINLKNIDFIISTVDVQTPSQIPIVLVDIPLEKKDIEHIARIITSDSIHPVDKIAKFFDKNLFIKIDSTNKEDAIHQLCHCLKSQKYITNDFETSVLERERKISTAMTNGVSLPHPLKICSFTSKIAVGILKNPINWDDSHNIQIILLLALSDDSKKDMEKLYDTFVYIMNSPSVQSKILNSSTLKEFLNILKDDIPISYY